MASPAAPALSSVVAPDQLNNLLKQQTLHIFFQEKVDCR